MQLMLFICLSAEISLEGELESLEKQKKFYLFRQRCHLRAAEESRGNSEAFLDAKRFYDLAEQQADKIRAIERQIEKLKEEN